MKVTKCPPGEAAGARDLQRWSYNRKRGRSGSHMSERDRNVLQGHLVRETLDKMRKEGDAWKTETLKTEPKKTKTEPKKTKTEPKKTKVPKTGSISLRQYDPTIPVSLRRPLTDQEQAEIKARAKEELEAERQTQLKRKR